MTDVVRSARARFGSLVRGHDEQIDLGWAALLLAAEEYPDMRPEAYTRRLDEMGACAEERVGRYEEPLRQLTAVTDYLFGALGLRGNEAAYYDPRNSYLNEVMDRGLGIPISLTVTLMEVARRAGLAIQGVGFPGHFLARFDGPDAPVFIDAFSGGELLSAGDCRRRWQEQLGGGSPFREHYLATLTRRQILTRMLTNLKSIYLQSRDYDRALRVVEYLLLISPWDLEQIRDRGLMNAQLGQSQEAIADLRDYLTYYHEPRDFDVICSRLEALQPQGT